MIKLKDNPIDGIKINMGGSEFLVPALNLKAIKRLAGSITDMAAKGVSETAKLDATKEVVHAALLRNYPEITLDEVEELLDMTNLKAVTAAIMGQSGFIMESGGVGNMNPATL